MNKDNLVTVEGHRPSLLWPPDFERDPARPPVDRARLYTQPVIVGPTIFTVDEVASFSGNPSWESWAAEGWVEVRAPRATDTLMLKGEDEAIAAARATEDHEQLTKWMHNEWRAKVHDVLVQRVEQTQGGYLRRQAEQRQQNVFASWKDRNVG